MCPPGACRLGMCDPRSCMGGKMCFEADNCKFGVIGAPCDMNACRMSANRLLGGCPPRSSISPDIMAGTKCSLCPPSSPNTRNGVSSSCRCDPSNISAACKCSPSSVNFRQQRRSVPVRCH
ncbi:unnamed protein product [Enterobius vermicularis]|uniref:EB domain-containing protein n=1 Tax=Enterobius vermicularis TaxID=51028 RepID=A0A0N4UWI8_ENTVE|nr:unnamed protein product [Enterobius vermicularis]